MEIPDLAQATTLWDYPLQSYGKSPKGNNRYPGVTPAFVIYNMVTRYTRPGELVLDPMAGSGTTIDVCKEEGRECIAYDIVPTRSDIIQNDARVLPLRNDSVDMVFVDPPYGDNIRYNDHPRNIGNLSAEGQEFYDELEKIIIESYRVLKPNRVFGLVISDQYVQRRFTPVGFEIYARLTRRFRTVDVIVIARRNQSSHTNVWLERAITYNFYLRGFKYLFIMRKELRRQADTSAARKIEWTMYDRGITPAWSQRTLTDKG